MKYGEKGFTAIELMVSLAIMGLIGIAGSTTMFQVIKCTERSNNHMTAGSQVQNAGYWISRDTQRAEGVTTDNLSPGELIVLAWTEYDYSQDESTYHSVTYLFDELSDGVGKLKRSHWSSAGANDETLVAQYIYYDPDDPANSSNASYENGVLTINLTGLAGDAQETRMYKSSHRPNL